MSVIATVGKAVQVKNEQKKAPKKSEKADK